MIAAIARVTAASAAILLAACANLPDPGTCGNGIVEPGRGEACDDGDGSELCNASCQLVCVDAAVAPEDYELAGSAGFCPAGYACGTDDVCRAPGGRFRAAGEPLTVDIDRVLVGDVDADGAADLIGTSDTRLHVFYGAPGDDAFLSAVTQPLAVGTGEPFAVDLAGDAATDVLLPVGGGIIRLVSNGSTLVQDVGVAFGEIETNAMNLDQVQVASAIDRAGNDTAMLIVPTAQGARPVLLDDPPTFGPTCLAAGRAIVPGFATTPGAVDAELFAFAMTSAAGATLCIYHPDPGGLRVAEVEWSGAYSSRGTLVFTDVDLDPCAELVFTSASGEVVAIDPDLSGCGFSRLATAFTVTSISPSDAVLAAGDFDGVDRHELVTRHGIYGYNGSGWTAVYAPAVQEGLEWDRATVADLDGDGLADVAATRARSTTDEPVEDLDVVLGRGTIAGVPLFAPLLVETVGNIRMLAVGDFDANRATDVALVEQRTANKSTLSVVHGNIGGFPDVPTALDELDGEVRIIAVGHRGTSPLSEDAYSDLAVARLPSQATSSLLGVAILFGTPNRVLAAPQWFPVGADVTPRAVVAYPFGDPTGPADAAIFGHSADTSSETTTPKQWFWPGAPDGTFSSGGPGQDTTINLGVRNTALAVARTADPMRAVIVAAADNGGVSTAYAGAMCSAASQLLLSTSPTGRPTVPHVAAIDVDGDARDEVIVAFDRTGGQNGGDAFAWIAPSIESGCALADKSTWLDLATLAGSTNCVDAAAIEVVIEAGGASRHREVAALCVGPERGRPEIRVVAYDAAGGHVPAGQPFTAAGDPVRIASGDFTGDGVEDLAVLTKIGQVRSLQLFAQCAKDDVDCE